MLKLFVTKYVRVVSLNLAHKCHSSESSSVLIGVVSRLKIFHLLPFISLGSQNFDLNICANFIYTVKCALSSQIQYLSQVEYINLIDRELSDCTCGTNWVPKTAESEKPDREKQV